MRSKSGGNSNVDQLRLMLSPSWVGNKSNVDTFTYLNVGRFPGCDHTGILVNFQTAPESYPFCSCTKLYMNRDSFVNGSGSETRHFLRRNPPSGFKKNLMNGRLEWGFHGKHPVNPGVSSSKSQSWENRTCGNFQVTAQSDVIKFPVQSRVLGLNKEFGKFQPDFFWRWSIQFDHVSTGLKPPTNLFELLLLVN